MAQSDSAICLSSAESGNRLKRQKLRVPRQNETFLAEPALAAVPACVADNQALFRDVDQSVQGRSFSTLRRQTRQLTVAAAARYLRTLDSDFAEAIGEVTIDESVPLIVGGHQPALFHSGVWAKNFSLAASANRTHGIALNLVIDNDTMNSSGVRVPAGSRDTPQIDSVAFDADRNPEPWEDARVLKDSLFASFADRVDHHMQGWGIRPLIAAGWPAAVQVAGRSASLRDALTAARVALERQHGVQNLELPLSMLCETEPFLRFASHVLAHLPRFLAIHNQVLNEYRQANRVRSKTHPVPELVQRGDWLEAPFWMWRAGDKQRRHVFARQLAETIELSDGIETFATLRLTPDQDACCAIETLQEIQRGGIRFRTRALTTTLFARLFLADLFVHGIGGAKYDEMTDRIIEEFFGITPPAFQVVSGTLHVPFAEPFPVTPEEIRQKQATLRDVGFNPQRHVSSAESAATASLINEKQTLIHEELGKPRGRLHHGENYDRYRRLRELNRELVAATSDLRESLQADLAQAESQVRANAIIQNREFSFALLPESAVRAFFGRIFNSDSPLD